LSQIFYRAFNLLEMMVIVVLITVLATLAYQSYGHYTVRTKIVSFIPIMSGKASEIGNAVALNGAFPASEVFCNSQPTCLGMDFITSFRTDTATTADSKQVGRVIAELQNLNPSVDGNFVYLEIYNDNGLIHTRCTRSAAIPVRYLPPDCQMETLSNWEL